MAETDPSPELALPAAPLQIPVFRNMWLATIGSNLGSMIQAVGAAWLMTTLTSSAVLVALVQVSNTLPYMLLALVAGAIADNLDRRLVMISAQIFMLTTSVLLTITAWAGVLTPWLLLTFTFLIGGGAALFVPAWQASIGDLVPRPSLPAAVALNSVSFNIARSVGPALGGAIVAAAGAAAAFLANALSYCWLILVLFRWRPKRTAPSLPRERIGAAIIAGFRYVSMSPHLRVVVLRTTAFALPGSAITALMPLVARDQIAGGPMTFGILLGAFGVGAVIAAFVSPRFRNAMPVEAMLTSATLAIAFGVAVTGISRSLPVTVAALLVGGAGWLVAVSTFSATIQMAAPRWVVGRTLATSQMTGFGAMAFGAWLFGEFAERQGVSAALLLAASIQALGALLGRWFPLPRVEDLNLDPLSGWTEPETAVPIEPRSGPIVVSIHYRIAPQDIPAFLAEMAEWRRVRIRDGARNWMLLRDLADGETWVERYHVATWLDYVRHNQRRTNEDAANFGRIRALNIDPDGPRVTRMIERQTGLPPPLAGARGQDDPLANPTASG